jgi:hypothetical protein
MSDSKNNYPWGDDTPVKWDSFVGEDIRITTASHEETEEALGMYISVEPFTMETVMELTRLLHGLYMNQTKGE